MTDLQFAEEILERLQERNPRFHGKAYLFLLSSLHAVLEDLAGRRNAVDLVRKAVEALGGQGGGGRPDLAQGGGPDGAKAAEALAAVKAALEAETLSA